MSDKICGCGNFSKVGGFGRIFRSKKNADAPNGTKKCWGSKCFWILKAAYYESVILEFHQNLRCCGVRLCCPVMELTTPESSNGVMKKKMNPRQKQPRQIQPNDKKVEKQPKSHHYSLASNSNWHASNTAKIRQKQTKNP